MATPMHVLQSELAALYASYEHELRAWIASYPRGISCSRGCRTCCDMSIGLYLPEAIVLERVLTAAQYAAVAAHAKRVVAYAGATPDYQVGYRYSEVGWCPFLEAESGACSIYDQRPANCRHVYSNMPPKYCAKGTEKVLAQDAGEQAAYLAQLDPETNEDDLPFLAPLHAIFQEQYELYLMMLNARHFNVIVLAEMSWLVLLAREYDLAGIASQPGGTRDDFIRQLQRTGVYHESLLTDCQEIPAHMREASAEMDFSHLP